MPVQQVQLIFSCLPLILCTICCGCSHELSRALPPRYSSQAGETAVSQYDTNRDGALGGTELDAVPALKSSLDAIDTDGNGQLTAAEINARVKQWLSFRIAEMPVRCEVLWNNEPLENAQVVFDPEPFLGADVHAAQGISTASGTAGISMAKAYLADERYAGVACGWYKIRVTSTTVEIPARYNTETTLGCEVAMNADWVNHGAVQLQLQNR